jgi:predicted Ser/Thr protein kinase
MPEPTGRFADLMEKFNREEFKKLHEEMSFSDYLELIHDTPKTIRTSHQIVHDMILEKDCEQFEKYDNHYTHYKFFDDFEFPIYGLEETLSDVVKFIKGAAGGYGTEKKNSAFAWPSRVF